MGDWIQVGMKRLRLDRHSFFWLFFKQLLIFAIEVLLEFGILFSFFYTGTMSGSILQANYADNVIQQNAEQILTSMPFDESLLPIGCTYALFDKDKQYMKGNMTDKNLRLATDYINKKYHRTYFIFRAGEREDGVVVLAYAMKARFRDERLYNLIPYLEETLLITSIAIFVLLIIIRALRLKRKMSKEINPLMQNIESINRQELENDNNLKTSKITEIQSVQNALNEMASALSFSLKTEWENSQKRRENMAALAHDIKTPLTVIKGNTELVLEDTLDQDTKELCQSILKNSNKIEDYIRLLMDESTSTDKDVIKIQDFADSIRLQCEELCNANRMPLEMQNTINPDKQIVIDVTRVQRAIMNIVKNATEYTDISKGIKVEIYDTQENGCCVSVKDYGSGFSAEALKYATDQFFTEKKDRGGEHYGMGLYFASCVTKECGGKLEIMNENDGAKVIYVING